MIRTKIKTKKMTKIEAVRKVKTMKNMKSSKETKLRTKGRVKWLNMTSRLNASDKPSETILS